jgi:acyl-CoA dehydrogenase
MLEELFKEEHRIFRESLREFIEKEVNPNKEKWEKDGIIPKSVWRKMGELGFLGFWYPEEYGGFNADFLYSVIFTEELCKSKVSGFEVGFLVHNEMATPPILHIGNEEQKKRWLPKAARGEMVFALGITEPFAGSDVAGIRTTAVRDGDYYIINGTKTFITNGASCDAVTLAVKTNPKAVPPHAGISLIVVEKGTPGFSVSRKLEKLGNHASDTAELVFEDCKVPKDNLLGEEGTGFYAIMQNFQRERLIAAIGNVVGAQKMIDMTIEYVKERVAFGKPLSKFQVIRHRIVDMLTEIEMSRRFVYHCVELFMKGRDATKEISMAKFYTAEMLNRVAYNCLQLFGGYGYMKEYPISQAYADARMATIAGGTSEIMKEIVAKLIGL